MRGFNVLLTICISVTFTNQLKAQVKFGLEDNVQGVFVDTRDNKEYSFKNFGLQCWMTENLQYNCEGSFSYYNEIEEINNGRFYSISVADSVCPKGWHLPSNQEWELLAIYINEQYGPFLKRDGDWQTIGGLLKASEFRNIHEAGLAKTGFNAVPTGYFFFNAEKILELRMKNSYTAWWSSTKTINKSNWIRSIFKEEEVSCIALEIGWPQCAYPIRCMKSIE